MDSYVDTWSEVQKHPEVLTIHMDQCMTGQMTDTGIPIQKKTEWTSNTKILLSHLQRRFQCDHSHKHQQVHGKALNQTKIYSWKLCAAVVTSIIQLKKELYQEKSKPTLFAQAPVDTQAATTYPTTATQSEPPAPVETRAAPPPLPPPPYPPPPMVPPGGLGCPGCHNNLRAKSPYHTRDPRTCRHT